MGSSWWWHKSPATEKPLVESYAPSTGGSCPQAQCYYRAEFGGSASGDTNGGTAIPIPALVAPSPEDAEFSPLAPLTLPGQSQAPAQQWGHLLGSRAGPGAAGLTLCYQTQGNHTFQIYLS